MASHIGASPERVGLVLDRVAFESLLSCKMLSPQKMGNRGFLLYLHNDKHFLLGIAAAAFQRAEWVETTAEEYLWFQQHPLDAGSRISGVCCC